MKALLIGLITISSISSFASVTFEYPTDKMNLAPTRDSHSSRKYIGVFPYMAFENDKKDALQADMFCILTTRNKVNGELATFENERRLVNYETERLSYREFRRLFPEAYNVFDYKKSQEDGEHIPLEIGAWHRIKASEELGSNKFQYKIPQGEKLHTAIFNKALDWKKYEKLSEKGKDTKHIVIMKSITCK